MKNFWKKLNKPFFCLAPMADVTDCAFRKIISKYGKPDVFWTEFVSADGLAHKDARKKLLIDLSYSKKEHPIVAQIFGSNPENIKKAAALCKKLGFDGIDINMGCPDRSIEKQHSGAAMIKNHELAKEIIKSAKEGAGGLPVSVKTRIGYHSVDMGWIKNLLGEDISALTVHLRTRKEMSKVPAHWDLMKEIVDMRNKIASDTLIIGNGDVLDIKDAKEKAKETGCDGVMLGRAIFGNPWLFANLAHIRICDCQIEHPVSNSFLNVSQSKNNYRKINSFATQSRNSAEHSECVAHKKTHEFETGMNIKIRLKILVEHTKLFEKYLGGIKSFDVMKKHFKAYVNGFDGAKELRTKLMETKNAKEVEKIIKEFLK